MCKCDTVWLSVHMGEQGWGGRLWEGVGAEVGRAPCVCSLLQLLEPTQNKHRELGGGGGRSPILNLRCFSGRGRMPGFSCPPGELRSRHPAQRRGGPPGSWDAASTGHMAPGCESSGEKQAQTWEPSAIWRPEDSCLGKQAGAPPGWAPEALFSAAPRCEYC